MHQLFTPLRTIAVLCLLVSLSACAGLKQPNGGRGGPPGPGQTDSPPPPDGSPTSPDGASHTETARLRGLAAAEISAKLGQPSFRRREPPAEIWQYFGPGCVLDLFLYDENGTQRVAHAELRSHNLTASGQTACLGQLLDGKRGDADS